MRSKLHDSMTNRTIESAARALVRCLLCSDNPPPRRSLKLYKHSITSDINIDIITDIIEHPQMEVKRKTCTDQEHTVTGAGGQHRYQRGT